MVNHKKKAGKRTKTTSNASQREKRTSGHVSSTVPSAVSDHERLPVVTSLPPAVDGHLRCFLRVSVPTIHWTVHKYPPDVQVQLRWWGEDGDGVLFGPIDDKATDQSRASPELTSVRYAVCSGPKQFNAYLKDMGPLIFDVVHGPSLLLLGRVRLVDVSQLSASAPIQGFFDVMSTSSPGEKIALLYIALRFESISAAYSQLSSSIPTVDMGIDPQRRRTSDESDVHPTPPPLSLNPATPITHPRQITQDPDPFVSPAVHTKGVKFAPNSPERLEYTAENSAVSATAAEKTEVDITEKQDDVRGTTRSDISASSVLQSHRSVSSDLIGALLQRGEKLREAMVMSADEDNDMDDTAGLGSGVKSANSPPGKLFKAILTSSETDCKPEVSAVDDSAVIESVFLHNNKAVDLLLGEEHMHYLEESPVSSPESSVVSEPGDPLYDETLLKDLFYTTPAMQSDTESDNTVSTDDDNYDDDDKHFPSTLQRKKISAKTKGKHLSPHSSTDKDTAKQSDKESSMGYLDPKKTTSGDNTDDHRGQESPNNTSHNSSSTSTRRSLVSSPNPHEFVENLGPEKLTALGRVDAARVMVDSLGINGDNMKPGTYFVEYSFPSSTPTHSQGENISMATELTRIASKKLQDGVVLFNHRSVFPSLFNSAVIDYWWRRPLTFRLYIRESGHRTPAVVGVATFPLKTVLQSDTLSSSASLQIKHSLHSQHDDSTSSSSAYHASGSDDHKYSSAVCGPLLVKVELMTDGKQLHIKPSTHRKPPLPTTTTPTKTTDRVQVTKPAQVVGQVFGVSSHKAPNIIKSSDRLLPKVTDKFDGASDHDRHPITLYTLLWVPEGSALVQPGFHSKQGFVSKTNLYLVCRMFWCDEVSKSRVCWGATNPSFGFKQVAPVLLSSSLLQRVCNNFMIIEVWNRIGPHDHGDQLLGLVKLPLHQLYLSYRDPKITTTLLKSKYPVIAVDEWSAVTNPFTRTQHGHLGVLLAMGSEDQIAAILTLKCGGDVPVGMGSRPDHHLDTQRVRTEDGSDGHHLLENQEFVEHQFEITVEDIRGLSVFSSTVWGETDCFVQYHFPFQRHQQPSDTENEAIPNLQPHRTPTTLCVPDPAFHDVARHSFRLPQGFPVQKHLLAAFSGSWVAAPSIPGSGGVPFELWRRYYYPNVRDQMVAKASLPLAKLCAMVTMQKQGEANVLTFSLPLTVLAGDEMDGMRQDRVHDSGLLDVTVKYQQVRSGKLAGGHTVQKEEDNHVCLSLEVFQACGLKAAALLHAKSNPSLSYPAEVGVNTYIVIQFPLGKKHKHVTRTVARTFSPEFSYNADILLPIIVPSGVRGKGNLCLAEQLEDSEMIFEVWHQMSRGMSGGHVTRSGGEARTARERDVLLGVGTVPLVMLLTHKTGIKGWFPIYLPSDSSVHDASPHSYAEKVVGGLQLSVSFSDAEDRDHVIHVSRGVGWSPPAGVECADDWIDKEETMSKERQWQFCLKISKAWIPPTELQSLSSGAAKVDKGEKAYTRYKLYNKAPICSRMSSVKESGDGKLVCELKHSRDTMLLASPSLTWHMREERLEIQLWLSDRKHDADKTSRKRDRLLGSAFVDVSSLLVSQQRKHRQISGLYPLFRSGANDLFGACVHVQASLNLCSESNSDPEMDLGQHVSSDESVDVSSPVEDHDTQSSTMISSQDHTGAKPTQHNLNRQQPITETSDDTFTAHVVIEQALHLPTVPGDNGERLLPNVYVSYQTLPSAPLSCTSVVMSSTSPSWEFQKLERISYTSLKSQNLVFKLWHTSGTPDKGVQSKAPDFVEGTPDGSSRDRVIGFVSFDLSPLLAGMRQLIGWYNITDFDGDCKGQIKLGVSPVIPVSPPRSLPASRTVHLPSPKQHGALADIPILSDHGDAYQKIHQDGSDRRLHTDSVLSDQLPGHQDEYLISFRPHALDGIGLKTVIDAEAPFDNLPACSTSLLFSQLRENMKELETLQQNLNQKLRSSNAWNDAGAAQEGSSVVEPPRYPFSGTGAAVRTSSKTLETVRTENTSSEGLGLESKLLRTEFGEADVRHGMMSVSGEKSSVPDDEHSPSSLTSPRERDKSHDLQIHYHTSEKTNDAVLVRGAGASNSKDIFPFDKGKEEHLQHDTEIDSFFSLERNKSSVEDRRPSVDSELSITDVSGEFSFSGYVQDNSKPTRFTDIKDSWLSSEEEDTTANVGQLEKTVGVPSSPVVFNVDSETVRSTLNNATETEFHQLEVDMNSDDADGGSDSDNGNHEKDYAATRSPVDADDSLEDDTENHHVNTGLASDRTGGFVNGLSDAKGKSFETDEENEHGSYASHDNVHSRELPRQAPLSSDLATYQPTSANLPNFFMPSEQLAESMRALRLGSSRQKANSLQSKLLDRSSHLKSGQQTKGKITERFAKREPVYKASRDGRPPISDSEADRIARIFNSGNV